MYIYRQLGISLPHKASSQFSTRYGTVIPSMSNLKPGDLVFYKNTAGRGITHAAIYVGNGMMVTANSPRQGVRLSSIHEAYWRSHWAGGLRVRG
jgi:cell wall-associated NlpC family hydrolase